MHRLRSLCLTLLDTLWFLPALIVCLSGAAAVGLVELESFAGGELARRWPRLLGAGAQGARGMLSAIATAMITVAGVVFSVTIVALSLAASQYSPRVLRNFMSDRPTQTVLGAFVGIFTYCLIVLRTIRGPAEEGFVPSAAVLGAVFLALVGVALLIYFIHHAATAIQAPYIVSRIAQDTTQAIDRLYPPEAEASRSPGRQTPPGALPGAWTPLPAQVSGYLVGIDADQLLRLAVDHSVVIAMAARIGEFVAEGRPLVCVSGARAVEARTRKALLRCLTIQRERTVDQDVPFGLQQLVDVAMKALSPGIQDPTTAAMCIDQLGALLMRLSNRRFQGPYRCCDGLVRVIVEGADYASMVSLAFAAIIDHAGDQLEVYDRLLVALARIEQVAVDEDRRAVLVRQVDALIERAAGADVVQVRREALLREARALRGRLAAPAATLDAPACALPCGQ